MYDTFENGFVLGFFLICFLEIINILFNLIYDFALDTKFIRQTFKFLSNDDVQLISIMLDCNIVDGVDCDIGRIIVNAYKNKNDLKTLKKLKRKKFFLKFKFWKKG